MDESNTDTPETDGEWNRLACQDHPEFERNLADFARKLERERDDSRKWSSTLADAGDEIRAQLREEQQLHIQTLTERDKARESRAEVVEKYQAAVKEMHETGAQRDEAIEIARKAMGTVMQIYGHAQFCNECQSFEIADSCRSQMHDMDRINSLLTECKRNENES